MLVKHLIRELQKCPQDLEVLTEGCDCDGDSCSVDVVRPPSFVNFKKELVTPRAHVYIRRSDSTQHNGVYKNTDDTPEPLPETTNDKG